MIASTTRAADIRPVRPTCRVPFGWIPVIATMAVRTTASASHTNHVICSSVGAELARPRGTADSPGACGGRACSAPYSGRAADDDAAPAALYSTLPPTIVYSTAVDGI